MRLVFFAVLTYFMLAAPAHAQRAVQVAPDGKLMVNKLFAGQQWSIVVDFDTQTIAGNVFNADGSEPQFVWCDIVEPTVTEPLDFIGLDVVTLDCQGADGCAALPCPTTDWSELGTLDVVGSFFVPAQGQATPILLPTPTATPQRTTTPHRTQTPRPTVTAVEPNPACGSPQCNFNWCESSGNRTNCPTSYNGDGLCDCGCQFVDVDCFATAAPHATSTPQIPSTPRPTFTPSGGGGGNCCKHCSTGKPCGDSCISFSFTCHQPPGCACF